ncbi:MAG: hypothetical protein P4L35_11115 [Ignavibacteriaceae bacterium]|nr:hypothetical protein [Ignavibacteriaceae bacterium]
MEISNIFYILLLASASGLCIALIFFLYKVSGSIKRIEIDINDLTHQVKPLIASSITLSEKLKFISDEAKQPLQVAKEIVEDIKDRIDVILELEEKLRKGVEGPLTKLLNTLSGVTNGINAFWDNYKKR